MLHCCAGMPPSSLKGLVCALPVVGILGPCKLAPTHRFIQPEGLLWTASSWALSLLLKEKTTTTTKNPPSRRPSSWPPEVNLKWCASAQLLSGRSSQAWHKSPPWAVECSLSGLKAAAHKRRQDCHRLAVQEGLGESQYLFPSTQEDLCWTSRSLVPSMNVQTCAHLWCVLRACPFLNSYIKYLFPLYMASF